MSDSRPNAGKVSLVYVCFFDYIPNGVKLGIANHIEKRAYHLSLDWGAIDTNKTFYYQSHSNDPSNEIRLLERDILIKIDEWNLKVNPHFPDGRKARGTGSSEFFAHKGIGSVMKIFKDLEINGKGKIIHGFTPSTLLPPLKERPCEY